MYCYSRNTLPESRRKLILNLCATLHYKALRIRAYLVSERITYGRRRRSLIAVIAIINSIHFQLRLINSVLSPSVRSHSLHPVRHRHKRALKFRRSKVDGKFTDPVFARLNFSITVHARSRNRIKANYIFMIKFDFITNRGDIKTLIFKYAFT